MSDQADGSIIIDTEIRSEGFKAGSAELLSAIKSLNVKLKSLGPAFKRALNGGEGAVGSFDVKAKALEATIDDLKSKLAEMGNQSFPTDRYNTFSELLDEAGSKMERLLAKEKELRAIGVSEHSQQWLRLQYQIEQTGAQCDFYAEKLHALEDSGAAYIPGTQTADYQQLNAALSEASARLAEMQASASQTEGPVRKTASLAQRIASSFGKAAKTVAGALVSGVKSAASHMRQMLSHSKSMQGQFKGLISSAKKFALSLLGARGIYALLRKAVSAYMSQNEELTQKLNACWSGIGNLLGPIITKLINLVSQAVAYVTAFLKLFSVFSGSATTAINNAGKAATGATKELKRQLASFDELNILSDKSGGNNSDTPQAELPEVELPDWVFTILDKVREIFSVFSDAWDHEGMNTINAIKTALMNILGMWSSIGASMNEVWQNGTGEQTLRTILGIIQGIVSLIGNLAGSFRRAWDENDRGTRLVQAIWNIFNRILEVVRHVIASTAEWADNLDFGPLLESLVGLFESLEPIIDGISTAIEWLWDHIVLPIFSWLIEDKIPNLIDGLTGINEFITGVFTGDWDLAWSGVEHILGSIFEDIYNDTFGVLDQLLSDWTGVDNWFEVEVLLPLGQFFSDTWDGISRTISDVWNGIVATWETVAGWFDENVLQPLWNFFEPIFNDIAVLASGCWSIIKEAWRLASSWFDENVIQPISGWFEEVWGNVENWASDAWEGIKSVFSAAGDWFRQTFEEAWGKVVEVFSPLGEIFVDIKNGIASVFTSIVNGLITGINKVIAIPFKGINAMIKKLRDANILGIQPFANLQDLNVPQIPLLQVPQAAKGAILRAGQLFQARESGPELVGSFGNKTGVMNNDQIVTSVSEGVEAAVSNVSNKLLSRMQAIAANVTFRMPAVAYSIAPYKAAAAAESGRNEDIGATIEASNDELVSAMAQCVANQTVAIIEAIKNRPSTSNGFDRIGVADAVIQEINRRTRMFNKSPLLGR